MQSLVEDSMDSLRISGLKIHIKPLCFSVFLFFSGTHSRVWTDMVYVAVINHCNCTIGNFWPPCWMATDILIAQGEIYWSTLCYILWLKLKRVKTGVKFGFSFGFSLELQIPLGLYEKKKKKWCNYLGCFCQLDACPIFQTTLRHSSTRYLLSIDLGSVW